MKFVEGIAAPHKAGLPAVMLHCSSHSYRAADTDEWRMCVGITSRSHEKNRDLLVQIGARFNLGNPYWGRGEYRRALACTLANVAAITSGALSTRPQRYLTG